MKGGGATPNDVELFDSQLARADTVLHGRTPLYWACFGGHVELVRELLLRGGVDHDGAAYIAVTTRQGADNDQDILFDPDTGVFSDFVDYDPVVSRREGGGEDDAFLIRAMLVAVKSAVSTNPNSLRRRLPKQLYHESSKECVVCWVNPANAAIVPCGHVACCTSCLTKVRKSRDGCPLCRATIVAIIPDTTVSDALTI